MLVLLLLRQTAFNVWFNHETGNHPPWRRGCNRFWSIGTTPSSGGGRAGYALYYYVRDC